jgi:eukaryotic-like serine/threonine-protein kinase
MALAAGTRIGGYEILGSLGAGGMGEVYRARDTRLNREIAIKVLPVGAALDPERRERFTREAQAIAALNHPNIVTIHSIEEIEGRSIITMEFVEGRPLADVIFKNGLPLDQFLRTAIPVADALAAAHHKGITHRDLKPANIMVGAGEHDGRVKVLDFGLAKLTRFAGAAAADVSNLSTAPITGEGRIVGTVAYMSPEQAEGKEIDSRSDLFSLGVILYEMAVGQRPFTGGTPISILSSIVKDTPRSVTDLNAELPRELGRIIRRALAKDPERRYQTAKDLRNDLQELKASLDSGELAAQSASGATVRTGPRVWQVATIIIAIGAVATIALINRARPVAGPTVAAAPATQMTRLTSTGTARLPALSPDGKYVAYVETDATGDSVWVRQITSRSTVRVVAPTREMSILGLAVTPDGSFVDFVARTGAESAPTLWRVPFLGGSPRQLVDQVWSAPGWSPDGTMMAFLSQNVAATQFRVVVANADGSAAHTIATRTAPQRYVTLSYSPTSYLRPLWLPDGQSVAVVATASTADFQIVGVNAKTGEETVLVRFGALDRILGMGVALAPDGSSFVFEKAANGIPAQLFRVRLTDGAETKLTNDVVEYTGASWAGELLSAARKEVRLSLWIADAAGRSPHQIGQDMLVLRSEGGLAWAGERIVFTAAMVEGAGLWSTSPTTGSRQLVVASAGGGRPTVTADGSTIAYLFPRNSGREVWSAAADGSHGTLVAGGPANWPSITPDGSAVFYTSGLSVFVVDRRDGKPRQFYPSASRVEVSPDGRLVMVSSRDEQTRSWTTAIMPIGGGEPLHRLQGDMGQDSFRPIHWTPDSRGLAWVDPQSMMKIMVRTIDGQPPRLLTEFRDGPRIVDFAWSRDGSQLAIERANETSDIVMLTGINGGS